MITPSGNKRYLMAIVFLDLTGYARLMAKSEALALNILQELEAIIKEEIPKFRGEVVKFGPDGIFCAFPTGVSAVSFAFKVQQHIASRNSKAGRAERFQVRMGIHLGDVMKEKGQLVGDAVNIATQIKPMGDPGGIAMTDTIHSQVKNQLALKGTFVSTDRHDLPEHMQVFLIPPYGKWFFTWNLQKHLGRTLVSLMVGLLAFSGTFYLMNRQTSQRMALLSLETPGDADSTQAAGLVQEELDQDLAGVPRLQWVGRDGSLYLLSQVQGDPPGPEVKALEAAKKGGLNYLMTCRLKKTPEGHWKLRYKIVSVRTLVVVGAAALEGTDIESLAQELRRQVTDWSEKNL